MAVAVDEANLPWGSKRPVDRGFHGGAVLLDSRTIAVGTHTGPGAVGGVCCVDRGSNAGVGGGGRYLYPGTPCFFMAVSSVLGANAASGWVQANDGGFCATAAAKPRGE